MIFNILLCILCNNFYDLRTIVSTLRGRTNLRVLCTIVRSKLSKLQALSPGRSFLFAWPTVNTKSRLWPSVFSVRLFQTQCQLAAGDVSTNLSHFHWRSRTLWNLSYNANNFSQFSWILAFKAAELPLAKLQEAHFFRRSWNCCRFAHSLANFCLFIYQV